MYDLKYKICEFLNQLKALESINFSVSPTLRSSNKPKKSRCLS